MITATVQSVEGNIIKVKALDNLYELDGFFGCGVHNAPVKGERVLVVNVNGNLFAICGGDNDIEVNLLDGERRIFSTKDSEIASEIHFGLDTLNLNGSDTNAVKYAELKTEFDKLKTSLNNLVSLFNSHIHSTTATIGASVATGVISATLPKASQNTSDITKVKSKKVMLG